MTTIFPRGIALGAAFHDRKQERVKLFKNIINTVHTVLIAPRRYGKTSLMAQVLHENKISHAWIDFMTITSSEEFQTKLLEKISQLIVSIASTQEKLKSIISKYFKSMKPEIVIGVLGISLKLYPGHPSSENIIEALINLDKIAIDLNLQLVIVFDEFQEIIRIEEQATLQASIRHAAERAKKITYLFSGSKHRPLRKLFNGKENPLYFLCDQINLNKIPADEYIKIINKAAKRKWGYALNDNIIEKIFYYTERYPKYLNALCSELWNSDADPTVELIESLWHTYVISRKLDITDELSELTLNQRRLLRWLCFHPTNTLFSKAVLSNLKLSQSSVQKAIEILLNKDFVKEEDGMYEVLDPIFKHYFIYY